MARSKCGMPQLARRFICPIQLMRASASPSVWMVRVWQLLSWKISLKYGMQEQEKNWQAFRDIPILLELFLSTQMERGCSLPVMTAQPVSGMQLLVNNCSICQNIRDGSGLLYLVQMESASRLSVVTRLISGMRLLGTNCLRCSVTRVRFTPPRSIQKELYWQQAALTAK